LKILQVSPFFYPFVGGQERYVRSLGRSLVKLGHDVVVLTSNFPKGRRHEVVDGMDVYRFSMISKPLGNPIAPNVFFNAVKWGNKFDVVHVHNEHSFLSNICVLAKACCNSPLIVSCHGQLEFNQPMKDLIVRAYDKTFGALVFNHADRIITISEADKRYVASLGISVDKINVIPNGIELSEDRAIEGNPRGFDFEGKQVVLFVGPIIRRKGPHILIQAIPKIVEDFENLVFLFVGGGTFKPEAQRLAKKLGVEDYTYFTGFISDHEVAYAYQQSDIVALPSFSEALSYSILDAFAFSKPVVSTSTPCITEYLNDSVLLVPLGDVEALASAIELLLTNNKLAKELGEKGRRLVETRFIWDFVVEEILEVYHEVARK
jgi:glycosyltransferase involved in cell wall biosynthesis